MISSDELKSSSTEELEARLSLIRAEIGGPKFCNGCGKWKASQEFVVRRDRKAADGYGRISRCKDCNSAHGKRYYELHKDELREKARKNQFLHRHVGRISVKEATERARSKIGRCEICGKVDDVFIDHDHDTDKRRGMLCSNCNFVLGHAKDSVDILKRAVRYLARFKED